MFGHYRDGILCKKISEQDREWFERCHPQHKVIGFIWFPWSDENKVVLKMKPGYKAWTPSGCVRDCGKYYIVAQYSRYDRVDKKTLERTFDVEDK